MNIIIFVVYMMFPFLIGKVLTECSYGPAVCHREFKFPFLIGKVLTLLRHLDSQMRVVRFQFPFLIGKVLTTAFKPL